MPILKVWNGSEFIEATGASGDVVGPGSSTDNAVARFDSTTGKLVQNSGVVIDDSGNMTGLGTVNGANPHDILAYDSGTNLITPGIAVNSLVARLGLANISGLAIASNSFPVRMGGDLTFQALVTHQLMLRGSGNLGATTIADSQFVGRPTSGNLGAVTATQARTIIGLENQTVLMPPLHTGSVGLGTGYLDGWTHFAYVGRAATAITTADIVALVAVAWVAGTWAEVGIFTGDVVANGNATLTRVGFTDVSATYNSTGIKVTTVALSGVSVGDDLWMAFSSDAGTVFVIRATLQDTIQSGVLQREQTRLSLITASTAVGLEGGGARGPWARVIL